MSISLGLSPASDFPMVSHLIEDKNVNKTQSLLPPTFLPRWWLPSLCSSHTNLVGFLKHTKHEPASGPLHLLSLPGMCSLQIPAWLPPFFIQFGPQCHHLREPVVDSPL